MLQAFFSQNTELSILVGFLIFEFFLLLFVTHSYKREKIHGWIMITSFLMLFFFGEMFRIIGIGILAYYSCKEFLRLLEQYSWTRKIAFFLLFFVMN